MLILKSIQGKYILIRGCKIDIIQMILHLMFSSKIIHTRGMFNDKTHRPEQT